MEASEAWLARACHWSVRGGGGGVDLTAFSVGAEGSASGDGAISYNNLTGVFTYTPPDLSAFITSANQT